MMDINPDVNSSFTGFYTNDRKYLAGDIIRFKF